MKKIKLRELLKGRELPKEPPKEEPKEKKPKKKSGK